MTDAVTELLADIREQPAVLARLLDEESAGIAAIARQVRRSGFRYIVIAGRGSSDNAAMYAQYLFGARNRLPVVKATPSLFTRYGAAPRLDDGLMIAVSASGTSMEVVAVTEEARRQGCRTIAITNTPESPLAKASEHVVQLHAGDENELTATKTYTASLAALGLLSAALLGDDEMREDLARLPDVIAGLLDAGVGCEAIAELVAPAEHAAIVGRGFNFATAHEAALTLNALTTTSASAYSAADFLHGRAAGLGGAPTVLFAPSGRVLSDVVDLVPMLRARDVPLAICSDVDVVLAEADVPLRLPTGVREWLSPIVAAIPGQILGVATARRQGSISPVPGDG